MGRESEARSISELTAWLKPSPSELGEMARRCELRFVMPAITENQPPTVTDEQSSALSLSTNERALLERILRDMHTGLRVFTEQAFAEASGQSAKASGLTLEEMLTDLQTRSGNGFDEARQNLAQERAGLASPTETSSDQPPGERLLRLWSSMGDDFERRLADDVGSDRAHQLRFSPHAGWTNRFAQTGCRSQR
jgi:hypothetical protein